jgi:hypothetical protein
MGSSLATTSRRKIKAGSADREEKNVPIYEDCNSKFGIGFIDRVTPASNPEQAKDFQRTSISSDNPKIGRNALIFWI